MRATLLFLFTILALKAQTTRLLIVGGPQPLWPRIAAEFEKRHPGLQADWRFGTTDLKGHYDLLFAYHPLPAERDALAKVDAQHRLGFPIEYVSPAWPAPPDEKATLQAVPYMDEGGIENGIRLLEYLYSIAKAGSLKPQPPITQPKSGIYHPDAPQTFTTFENYRAWSQSRIALPKATIAVPIFSTWVRSQDLASVDAIIRKLEAENYLPVAAYGYPLEALTPLFTHEAKFQPQVVLALNATLPSAKDAATYESWGAPVLNGLVTRESSAEWQANPKGLPADRIHAHLSLPERSGLIAPTLVATTESNPKGLKSIHPHNPGIDLMVDRVSRLLALQSTPNANKRIATIYYNNPAGKGNIGASYLQIFPSLRNILNRLANEGYSVTKPLPTEAALRASLEFNGNIAGKTIGLHWPIADYREHYDKLPAKLRESVEATWGPPENSEPLALPMFQQGNIVLAPQPLRTTSDRAADPGHELRSPPPHQYIAFYLYLRHVWKADAFIHLGRHGTLEWLPGKQTALEPEAAAQLLAGPIPNINVYVMDGGGEAIQAKRRGAATLVSHLTPTIWRSGGRDDIEKLHQSFHELVDRGDSLTPALSAEYERVTRSEIARLGLDRQLRLDMKGHWKTMAPALHTFLHEIEDSPIPAGLPIFGQSPSERHLKEAVGAFLFAAFPADLHDDIEEPIPTWSTQLLRGDKVDESLATPKALPILQRTAAEVPAWLAHMRASGDNELAGLTRALTGAHIPSRLLGDPLRRPEALPVGGNLHAVDGSRVPTQAAWRVGQTMAKEMLNKYVESHGSLPKRVSSVLWFGETERHQGAMESMSLYLMGVRPVWNARGVVEDVELITPEELGRPRIDVVFTVSGNYRDGFPDKLQWLDRAVNLAANAPNSEIGKHNLQIAAHIQATGATGSQALEQSRLRIFSAKPGSYGVGNNTLEQSADLFKANMGYGYGGGKWGEPTSAALEANLKDIDTLAFSRSSNLYGALDNNDTYQFLGGLRSAINSVSGRNPEIYLHNLRNSQGEKVTALREWLAIELHSRQLNPKWIAEMKGSGYAGARQISGEIEHLYGFQKTTPDHLDGKVWQTVMDVYVKDKYKLGLNKFFATQNPHARQAVLARLIEVDRAGIQKFSEADKRLIAGEYAKGEQATGGEATTQKPAAPQPPKPKSPTRLSELRTLGNYNISWVKKVVVNWDLKSISWQTWLGMILAYAAIVMLRSRGKNDKPISLV